MPWYAQNLWVTAGTSAATSIAYWPYQTQTVTSAATNANAIWFGGQTFTNIWWPEMQQSVLPQLSAHTERRLDDMHFRAQERAIRRRAAEMARHSENVQQRARELLLRNLTQEQRDSFNEHKFFVVEGRSGDRYRIEDRGHMVGNVAVLSRHIIRGEVVKHRLCGHCDRSIPLADQLLAQKLMIEGAEDEFLRIANRHAA